MCMCLGCCVLSSIGALQRINEQRAQAQNQRRSNITHRELDCNMFLTGVQARITKSFVRSERALRCEGRCVRAFADKDDAQASIREMDSAALPVSFCIIEDRSTVQNFAKLQLDEIKQSIQVRFETRQSASQSIAASSHSFSASLCACYSDVRPSWWHGQRSQCLLSRGSVCEGSSAKPSLRLSHARLMPTPASWQMRAMLACEACLHEHSRALAWDTPHQRCRAQL